MASLGWYQKPFSHQHTLLSFNSCILGNFTCFICHVLTMSPNLKGGDHIVFGAELPRSFFSLCHHLKK